MDGLLTNAEKAVKGSTWRIANIRTCEKCQK